MYEKGIVEKISGSRVTVSCGKPEKCGSCSSSFCNVKTKKFDALNRYSIDIREGDCVEIYLSPAKAIISSFMVLIFPLILFIAGYFIFGAVFKTDSDALRAGGGVAGLAAGFIISFVYNMLSRNRNLPVIIEKL